MTGADVGVVVEFVESVVMLVVVVDDGRQRRVTRRRDMNSP
jgi:hypothetical protein